MKNLQEMKSPFFKPYLGEEIQQKVEDMRIVQRRSFIQQNCVNILQKSLRGHQHHYDFSVNLLGVENVQPQLGEQLKV